MKIRYTVFCLAIVVTACAHQKKQEDPKTDAVESSGTIVTTPIELDPLGSDGNQIQGLVTIHFGFDDAKLDEAARGALAKDKDWIESHPNLTIQIEGHCDHRGSGEYNLALGERRAYAVRNFLIDLGVEKSRLKTISYGDQKPLASGETEEAFAKNRRVNFVPVK